MTTLNVGHTLVARCLRLGYSQGCPNNRFALSLRVVGESLPVDYDAWLISNNPRIVPRSGSHEIARTELHFLSVVHHDLHATGDEVAHVGCLATVCLGDRLHVFRPFPPWLERRAAYRTAFNIHYFELALTPLKESSLLGRIKALANEIGHDVLPSVNCANSVVKNS